MAGTINNTINTAINEEETIMTRANRVTVKATETGYVADFFRTHKHVGTMTSTGTEWQADETMNKTAQREDFRKFAVEHAREIGVEYDPTDRRTEENKRNAKYETDEDLALDTIVMMREEIRKRLEKCPYEVVLTGVDVDGILPVYSTSKGTDLTTLGVEGGKYVRTGNWAWARIAIVAVVEYGSHESEIYYTTECELVSGQLKKPHITQTDFNADIKQSLLEAGIIKEEEKEENEEKSSKKTKKEDPQEEIVEVVKESKPKRTRRSKKQQEVSAQ